MLATMHFPPVLRTSHTLQETGDGNVERGILVGARRFGAHHGPRPDQREFDPVIAVLAAELLVVTAHFDLEGDRAFCEVSDLSGLLRRVFTESIGDAEVASDDVDFHEGLPDRRVTPPGSRRASHPRLFTYRSADPFISHP